ncbi:DUF91 domain-containing protein [Candidatus Woesearchaeota archaeon]|nr:DUF91 domain-containing protein [Candidatus Woesearchaeota archaeon]
MPNVNFLKNIEELDLDEKEIQILFEKNLSAIEEGLQPIASFLPIGTGVIDMLAIDEDNNPVIIEFKRIGNFDRDALIQVMNYYSWFISDGNHILYINEVIKKANPELDEVSNDLRLIIVVSDVEDEVKNACWSLEPPIKLVTYLILKGEDDKLYIAPKIVLDTSTVEERTINPPKTEEDHFRGKDRMRSLYRILIAKIRQNIDSGIQPNPSPQYYIGLANKKNFCAIKPKKQYINIDLLLTPSDVKNSQRFKEKYPNSKWGKVKISNENDIDEELISWIRLAYSKAS